MDTVNVPAFDTRGLARIEVQGRTKAESLFSRRDVLAYSVLYLKLPLRVGLRCRLACRSLRSCRAHQILGRFAVLLACMRDLEHGGRAARLFDL